MEEQILKLIQWALRQPHNEEVCEEIAAKEIAEHFENFMEWMRQNKAQTFNEGWLINAYMGDEEESFNSGKEMYDSWSRNFNNNNK